MEIDLKQPGIEPGMVSLVGAGPGEADLLTIKGLKRLQSADVVIYDRLVRPEIIAYAPPWAELVFVGKEPGGPSPSQEAINRLMIAYARQGKCVVRLKGGDPFVFGRGGEECLALAAAGIRFEVVPGISSALAVPAYAGIPVTHRNLARSFTVVTGHTCQAEPCDAEWDDLPLHGTLVILMGVQNLPRITQKLLERGRAADTPAAVIAQGTTDAQTTVVSTLADIAEKSQDILPPAVIVIGEVVSLSEQTGWFGQHPLPIQQFTPFFNLVEE